MPSVLSENFVLTAKKFLRTERRRLSVARTEFDSDDHQLGFVNARIEESKHALEELRGRAAELAQAQAAAQDAADEARAADEAATERLSRLDSQAREFAVQVSELQAKAATLEAEGKALAEIERTGNAAGGAARAWVMEGQTPLGDVQALSGVLRVDAGFDRCVEQVLKESLSALVVQGDADIAELKSALDSRRLEGGVAVYRAGRPVDAAREWVSAHGGDALCAHVSAPDALGCLVDALMGDAVLVESFAEAVACAGRAEARLRFVTRDGDIAATNGLVSIASPSDEAGVLARKRRARECAAELEQVRTERAACEERRTLAEAARQEAHAESLVCARRVAETTGAVRAAQSEAEAATAKVTSAQTELDAYISFCATLQSKQQRTKPLIEEMEARTAELSATIEGARAELAAAQEELDDARARSMTFAETLSARIAALSQAQSALVLAKSRLMDRASARKAVDARTEASILQLGRKAASLDRLAQVEQVFGALSTRLDALLDASGMGADGGGEAQGLADRTNAARQAVRELRTRYDEASQCLADNRVETAQLKLRVESALDVITRECKSSVESALRLPELTDRETAEQRASVLKRRIANLGAVSPEAAEEYRRVKARYDFLGAQLADLERARASLKKIDAVIDSRMRDDFVNTFAEVNDNFRDVFSVLFPGGSAELVLVDPDDIENTGVEVVAQPRGKRITKMMLMSGGEKSLTALALLFAVYKTRSTPFYVLDEVEAALDDTNLRRLLAYLEELRTSTQLILITHQRRTMESADVLFGVSMQNDGVTKVISQRLERALAYAE